MAQISLVDGSLTSGMVGVANLSASPYSVTYNNFTVSSSADALVVQVYDRNQALSSDTSGGSTGGLDPLSLAWGTQSIGRVGYQNNLSSHWGDSIIYVLYNPIAGVHNITYTDPNGSSANPPSNLSMQIYSLSGVNTSIAPAFFSIGNANLGTAHQLSLNVNATTAGAWASIIASSGDSGFSADSFTTTSGTLAYQWLVENQSTTAGADQGLPVGPTTITFNDPTISSVQVGFAAAVFEPIPEPSTLFFGGLGLLGFISFIRRKIS